MLEVRGSNPALSENTTSLPRSQVVPSELEVLAPRHLTWIGGEAGVNNNKIVHHQIAISKATETKKEPAFYKRKEVKCHLYHRKKCSAFAWGDTWTAKIGKKTRNSPKKRQTRFQRFFHKEISRVLSAWVQCDLFPKKTQTICEKIVTRHHLGAYHLEMKFSLQKRWQVIRQQPSINSSSCSSSQFGNSSSSLEQRPCGLPLMSTNLQGLLGSRVGLQAQETQLAWHCSTADARSSH